MKKSLKFLALAFVAFMMVACGAKKQDAQPLLIGMEAGYPPYNWTQSTNANGAVPIKDSKEFANGYDVQIARKIGEKLGREVQVVKTEWDGLLPAVQSDKIDMIIAGMSPTAERAKEIDFSESYYDSRFVMVVRKDSPYAQAKTLDDFAGAKVSGQQGTLHYDLLKQLKDAQVEQAQDSFPVLRVALEAGKLDAYISEYPEAVSAAAANPLFTYVELNPSFQVAPEDRKVSIGVKKGSPLMSQINEAIAEITDQQRKDFMDQAIKNQPAADGQEESNTEAAATEDYNFFARTWEIATQNWRQYLAGTGMTLWVSLTGTLIGLLIGLAVGIIRTIPKSKSQIRNGVLKVANLLLNAYIAIFRGTPMIVQAMIFYYGTDLLWGWKLTPMSAAFLVVSINTGAYIAEVVRGGIYAIDKGQFEAARAIGMNHWQTMKEVVMPQVFRTILPSVGNEFVINVKDTSVLNVISVSELYFTTKTIAGNNFRYFETFFVTAVIYFILTFTITSLLRAIEKRIDGRPSDQLAAGNQQQVAVLKEEA